MMPSSSLRFSAGEDPAYGVLEAVERGEGLADPQLGVGAGPKREDLGAAPVHDVDLAEAADEDVAGLDVAVEDAAAVGEGDGVAGLEEDGEASVQALGVAGGPGGDELVEALAGEQLHREEEAALGIAAELVDRCDVGVVELAGDLGLTDEAVDEQVVAVGAVVQELGGDPSLQAAVEGDAHGPDAAGGDLGAEAQAVHERGQDGVDERLGARVEAIGAADAADRGQRNVVFVVGHGAGRPRYHSGAAWPQRAETGHRAARIRALRGLHAGGKVRRTQADVSEGKRGRPMDGAGARGCRRSACTLAGARAVSG